MSLRWRIATALAASAFAVGAAAATVAYLSTSQQLRSGIDESLRTSSNAVLAGGSTDRRSPHGGDGDTDPQLGELVDLDCPADGVLGAVSWARIISVDGRVTQCVGPITPYALTSFNPNGPNVTAVRTIRVDHDRYRVLTSQRGPAGTLQIGRNLEESDKVLERVRFRLGLLVVAASIVAAAIGWAIATHLVRPIIELRDATRRIASTNDLSMPVDVRTGGEVGELASDFAAMVSALRRSQDQQRRLVSDASHEMRTPLTSLRSNLHLVGELERLPADERSEVVSDVIADVDELAVLLEELVDLASDMANAEANEPVNLGDLARTVATRSFRRTGRIVEVDDVASVGVVARPRQMERAIANLVDNAIKYSPLDSPVSIVVSGSTVTVMDRGRGLPPGEEHRIFERFYRAVDVRSEPGSGLGLAIVEEIVRVHGGEPFARPRDGGGSEVGFTVPSPQTYKGLTTI